MQIKSLGIEKITSDDTDLIPIQESGGITRHISRGNFLTELTSAIATNSANIASNISAILNLIARITTLESLNTGNGGTSVVPWAIVSADYSPAINTKAILSGSAVFTVTLPTTFGDIEIYNNAPVDVLVSLTKFKGVSYATALKFNPGYTRLLWVDSTTGWYALSNSLRLANDDYFSFVALLMHFDGANNSTTFTEVTGKTISTSGSPIISTIRSKFGNSSLYLNGTNAVLGIARTAIDLRSSVNPIWTIECWIYPLSQTGSRAIFTTYNNPGGAQSGALILATDRIGTDAAFVTYALPTNQWLHWAVNRDSFGVISLYLNGILTKTITANPTSGATTGYIGGSPGDNNYGSSWLNAYIDDFRITLGKVRYSANFTPPLDPFSNA
ncbi:LamG domain-containing protein [Nostoc favosum]|uniref:LamG domain-containing protein n=1 Tax=Nostoc favosum CHAB5714 TaxID=2780399 RepID=A0ABS8I842_9NOSO|nr:LamG domain-containing protein [Nostoc favosum]MCC5599968.1 LamG domain-containing protein [Nostoc favosum CHAB5714]